VELFKTADLVLVTTETLGERALRYRSRVHLFPFGVNYREFEQERLSPTPPPADVRDLPRPRVGYLGGINQKLDQALLIGEALAARRERDLTASRPSTARNR
jgi:hypothetical protein